MLWCVFKDIDRGRERGLPGVRGQRDRLSEEERDPLSEAVLQASAAPEEATPQNSAITTSAHTLLLLMFARHTLQEDP